MRDYDKGILSGSTDGKGIKLTTVATPGDLIHTAVAGVDFLDELWLWAINLDNAGRTITVQYGGVTDPDHLTGKQVALAANSGPIQIVPGWLLRNGLIVRCFASVANVVIVQGYVNFIR